MKTNILLDCSDKSALEILKKRYKDPSSIMFVDDIDNACDKIEKLNKKELCLNKKTNIYIYSSCNIPRYLLRTNENIKIIHKKENADIIVIPNEIKSSSVYFPYGAHIEDKGGYQSFFYSITYSEYLNRRLGSENFKFLNPKYKEVVVDVLNADDNMEKYYLESSLLNTFYQNKQNEEADCDNIFELLKSPDKNNQKLGLKLLIQTNLTDNRVKLFLFLQENIYNMHNIMNENSLAPVKKILKINKLRNIIYLNVINKFRHEYNTLSVSDKKLYLHKCLEQLKIESNCLRRYISDLPFELTMNLKINDPDLK